MKTIHLIISGKVQGVCFRANTKDQADLLGVKGWVKNLPDGTVEAVIQGDDKRIVTMLKYCYEGPKASIVNDVKIDEPDAAELFDKFEVRY